MTHPGCLQDVQSHTVNIWDQWKPLLDANNFRGLNFLLLDFFLTLFFFSIEICAKWIPKGASIKRIDRLCPKNIRQGRNVPQVSTQVVMLTVGKWGWQLSTWWRQHILATSCELSSFLLAWAPQRVRPEVSPWVVDSMDNSESNYNLISVLILPQILSRMPLASYDTHWANSFSKQSTVHLSLTWLSAESHFFFNLSPFDMFLYICPSCIFSSPRLFIYSIVHSFDIISHLLIMGKFLGNGLDTSQTKLCHSPWTQKVSTL